MQLKSSYTSNSKNIFSNCNHLFPGSCRIPTVISESGQNFVFLVDPEPQHWSFFLFGDCSFLPLLFGIWCLAGQVAAVHDPDGTAGGEPGARGPGALLPPETRLPALHPQAVQEAGHGRETCGQVGAKKSTDYLSFGREVRTKLICKSHSNRIRHAEFP